MDKELIVSKVLDKFNEEKSKINEIDFKDKLPKIHEAIIRSIVETLIDEFKLESQVSD